jgi:ABC-2 type transport system ATP-binding protein
MSVVEARDLRRTYKTSTGVFRRRALEVEAVRGVSFEIAERRAVRPARAQRRRQDDDDQDADHAADPDLGIGEGARLDVVKDAREVRKRIGYVFGGERGLYERLSAYDNLRYFAELYAVPPRRRSPDRRAARARRAHGREKERVEGYSRGMRQRLHIARGLLHDRPSSFSTSRRSASTRSGARSCARRSPG